MQAPHHKPGTTMQLDRHSAGTVHEDPWLPVYHHAGSMAGTHIHHTPWLHDQTGATTHEWPGDDHHLRSPSHNLKEPYADWTSSHGYPPTSVCADQQTKLHARQLQAWRNQPKSDEYGTSPPYSVQFQSRGSGTVWPPRLQSASVEQTSLPPGHAHEHAHLREGAAQGASHGEDPTPQHPPPRRQTHHCQWHRSPWKDPMARHVEQNAQRFASPATPAGRCWARGCSKPPTSFWCLCFWPPWKLPWDFGQVTLRSRSFRVSADGTFAPKPGAQLGCLVFENEVIPQKRHII